MSIAPTPLPVHPPSSLDPVDAAGVVAGTYVIVVRVSDGHYRRRSYLSLRAAERAAERARARGQGAEVVLCRLLPVFGWSAREAIAQAEQAAA